MNINKVHTDTQPDHTRRASDASFSDRTHRRGRALYWRPRFTLPVTLPAHVSPEATSIFHASAIMPSHLVPRADRVSQVASSCFGSIRTSPLILEPITLGFENLSISAPSPLEEAFEKGDRQEVMRLLGQNGDIHFFVGVGRVPPLHYAVQKGWLEVVKKLLELHVDVNATWQGKTALYLASRARTPSEDIIIALLDAGVNPNTRLNGVDHLGHDVAFHNVCAKKPSEKVLLKFLEKGVQIDIKDSQGDTALTRCCLYLPEAKTAVLWLLKNGANIGPSLKYRSQVIHLVFRTGWSRDHEEVAAAFLARGADINSKDICHDTIFETCLMVVDYLHYGSEEMTREWSKVLWLLGAGAKLPSTTHAVIADLIWDAERYCSWPNKELAKQIIQKLVFISPRDSAGNTILHWLADNRRWSELGAIWGIDQIPDALVKNHAGHTFVDLIVSSPLEPAEHVEMSRFLQLFYYPFGCNALYPRHVVQDPKESEKNLGLVARSPVGNPLEPLFMLSQCSLAASMEPMMGRERFMQHCSALAKRFPASARLGLMLEPVSRFELDTLYSINQAHLALKKFTQPIPCCPSNVELSFLKEIEALFQKINMIDATKPGYVPPATFDIVDQKEGLGRCRQLIANIQGQLFGLTNSEKYKEIYSALYHIIKTISKFDLGKKEDYEHFVQAMRDLMELWNVCGPAMYMEVIERYIKIVQGIDLSLENMLLRGLSQMRRDTINTLICSFIPNVQTRHDYIAIAKTHPELGLPESEFVSNLNDIFQNCLTRSQHPVIALRFWHHYTPSNIVEYVRISFLGDAKNRERFIDWCTAHIPAQFVGTNPSDRACEYLAKVVYDDEGMIRAEAIRDVLLQMGILVDSRQKPRQDKDDEKTK